MDVHLDFDRNITVSDIASDDFPKKPFFEKICKAALISEGCPFDTHIELIVTDAATVREMNKTFRGMDSETDVLSFPMVEFQIPCDFSFLEEKRGNAEYFNPQTHELELGAIVICEPVARCQAETYGHGLEREAAFLTAHSMYHLMGCDHIRHGDAAFMEKKQESLLESLGILR